MAGNPVYPDYTLDITNWENWGKLVKTWATGENAGPNRVNNGTLYPWPTTIADLVNQMTTAGTGGAGSAAKYLAVRFVQMSDTLLIIALPSKQDILDAEAKINGIVPPDYYTVAPFYKADCGNVELKCTYANDMRFNNERVGEYVISYCG